jgi:hypothetical protein
MGSSRVVSVQGIASAPTKDYICPGFSRDHIHIAVGEALAPNLRDVVGGKDLERALFNHAQVAKDNIIVILTMNLISAGN